MNITFQKYIKLPSFFIIGLIMMYRICISPFIPSRCRFLPTCSVFGIGALKEYGCIKGMTFMFKRIGRCHPWGETGYDPVPKYYQD